jgi:hypothetical protein
MPLTSCRACGAAVPADSHACPKCGAAVAPVSPAPYPPAPRRPPEEPERPGWLTAVGWVVVVALCGLFALFFFRASSEADGRATERKEVAQEQEHMLRAIAWMQDTSANAPLPESAGRPAPTSDLGKRMWVVNRTLVDAAAWEREVMARHGVRSRTPPAAWWAPRYIANARAFPEVERYLEGRVAAIAEIEKTSAAWAEERIAALARETGMPASEVRGIFPRDFVGVAADEARQADALLQVHRYLVRVGPRVHPAAGNQQGWEREEELRRFEELVAKTNDAAAYFRRARSSRVDRQVAALNRWIR